MIFRRNKRNTINWPDNHEPYSGAIAATFNVYPGKPEYPDPTMMSTPEERSVACWSELDNERFRPGGHRA